MYWWDSRGRRWSFMCQYSWIDDDILAMIVENMDEWHIIHTWWDWDVYYNNMRTYLHRKIFCRFEFMGELVCMEHIIRETRQCGGA